MKKVYCVGGAAIDRKLRAKAPIIHATSNPVTTTTHFGGVARNVAENLSHWSQGIYLHTIVGEDDEGIQLLSSIKQKGVDITQSVILKSGHTANYYALMEPSGELNLALADMTIFDQVPLLRFTQGFSLWQHEQIIFLDTNLSTEIIATVIAAAIDKKIRLCVDPVSISKTHKLPKDLHGIYLIKPNPHEAGALTGLTIETVGDAFAAGEILRQRGAENVIITLGKAGYVIMTDEVEEFICIDAIHDVINVNGAGDAFMAGIIYGLQQNFSLLHACQWGAAAAAFTVTSADTVAANVTASQLQAFIHNQKKITGQHEKIF